MSELFREGSSESYKGSNLIGSSVPVELKDLDSVRGIYLFVKAIVKGEYLLKGGCEGDCSLARKESKGLKANV